MKQLLKHCGILVAQEQGFRFLEDAFLGIDGDTIDYIGTERPQEVYDREKDLSGRLLLPGSSIATGTVPWCFSGALAAICLFRSGSLRR